MKKTTTQQDVTTSKLLKLIQDMVSIQQLRPQLTLKQAFDNIQAIEETRLSDKYLESWRIVMDYAIKFFSAGRMIGTIKQIDAELFIAKIQERAKYGVHVYLRTIKAIFSRAVKWQYISTNPFKDIKLRKRQKDRPVFMSEEEVRRVAGVMSTKFADIVITGYFTGMRANEILSLRREDIMDSERMIRVGSKDFETKARKVRLVPVHYALWPIIERNIRGKNKGDFVFGKRKHAKYTVDCVSKKFKKACREAGLSEEIHFHSLRHSFGTNAIAKGAPITAVRDIMGHSSIQVTQIYAHTDDRMLREAIEKL